MMVRWFWGGDNSGAGGAAGGAATGQTTTAPTLSVGLTKPLVKIDINGYGVIKTFQVESQETFHELCLRVADKVMIDPKEAEEYRIFLIDTNKDTDSLLFFSLSLSQR